MSERLLKYFMHRVYLCAVLRWKKCSWWTVRCNRHCCSGSFRCHLRLARL